LRRTSPLPNPLPKGEGESFQTFIGHQTDPLPSNIFDCQCRCNAASSMNRADLLIADCCLLFADRCLLFAVYCLLFARRPNLHPGKGLTLAQAGPPSLPVPGTRVSSSDSSSANARSTISQVIPVNGIFSRRLQHVSVWPAYVPMSM
jgi:hypothetical protein